MDSQTGYLMPFDGSHDIPHDPYHWDVLAELVNAQEKGQGVLEEILRVAMMNNANYMPGPHEMKRALIESDVDDLVKQMVARQTGIQEAEKAKLEAEAKLLQAQSKKEAAEKIMRDAQLEADRLQAILNNGVRNTGGGTNPTPNAGGQDGDAPESGLLRHPSAV